MRLPVRPLLVLAALTLHATAIVDDDLFTGAPNAPKPRTRPDPTATDWDRMLEENETAPLKIPATSTTTAEQNRRAAAWWKKHAFDPQRVALRGQPGEKEALALLDKYEPWFTDTGLPPPGEVWEKLLLAIAEGAVRRPALDFLVGENLIVNGRFHDGGKLLLTVADSPADAPVPDLMRLFARARALDYLWTKNRAAVPANQKLYFDLLEKILNTPCSDEDAEILVRTLLLPQVLLIAKNAEDYHGKLLKASKIPDWARFTIGGTLEMSRALRESDHGMHPHVHPDPICIEDRFKRARELFKEAWRLHPESEVAALQMITVIRNGHGGEDDTLRPWVDRAFAARCDSENSAKAFLNASRPRWGGTYEDMLAFGRACAETNRYDSHLPTFLNRALEFIALDLDDWRTIYRRSKLAPLLLETREKCLQGATNDMERHLHRSSLLYESWAAGDFERANRMLALLPRNPVGGPYTHNESRKFAYNICTDAIFPMLDTALRASPAREPYENGIAARDTGNHAEARTQFKAALAKSGDFEKTLLNAEITLADFQERYATGDWTPLPLHERQCWNVSEGHMWWLPKTKRARFGSSGNFGKVLFRGVLSDSFEVRGHFMPSAVDPMRLGGGLAVYAGHTPDTCGRAAAHWWVGRADLATVRGMTVDFSEMFGRSDKIWGIPWQEDTIFAMRREKGRITFIAGSREVKGDIPEDAPAGPDAFGLGSIMWPGGDPCEMWDVEVRNLNGPRAKEIPLAVTTPDKKKKPPQRPAPPPAPPPIAAADRPKVIADATAGIVGVWVFSWDKDGWAGLRNFKADGTVIAQVMKGVGKWTISDDKVILNYPDGSKDEMLLPLDPKGTRVIGKQNRVLNAVKQKP